MKKQLLSLSSVLFLLTFLLSNNSASAQGWEWSRSSGGGSNDGAFATTTDRDGNVYTTGYFTFSGEEFFLTKYDAAGNAIWTKFVLGPGNEVGNGVATDTLGNIYVTGNFSSPTLVFGDDTLTRGANKDIFIVKYDTDGNVVWARSAEGTMNTDEQSDDVTVDVNGDILITGDFGYDSLTFGSVILPNPGAFIAKYDSLGNVIWAKSSVVPGGSYSIRTDGAGNIFTCGTFGLPTFGYGGISLTNSDAFGGTYDMYVFKFSSLGVPIWGRVAGAFNEYEHAYGLAADVGGNVYITGDFTPAGISFGSFSLTSNGVGDSYIVKYSPTGTALWAKNAGGSGGDCGTAVALDNDGNVYQTGVFTSNIAFGVFTLTNATPGTYDLFVTKYDPAGNVLWAKSEGGNNVDYPFGISVSTDKGVYVAGNSTSTDLTFGNNVPLNNVGLADAFLAKYHSCSDINYAPICIVTVDSLSLNNIITWDKTGFDSSVDSFIVYREVQSNLYLPIGAVPFDSLSLLVDTARTLYFPTYFSSGDPNAGTYRYKIAVRDTCGTISQMSAYHNTIFVNNTSGTFSWPQLYSIEGQAGPVASSYVLMRDNLSNGNWIGVNSVTGTQQSITDPQYATYQSTASWYVRTTGTTPCIPTRGAINTSRSNIKTNSLIGIKENASAVNALVYPNPATNNITVELNSKSSSFSYELVDVLGQLVLKNKTDKAKITIDITGFAKGVYFMRISEGNNSSVKKIIIE